MGTARFTTWELSALAEYAHDLERLALDKLAATALFAIHADDADTRVVWAENYYRGWRFGESDAYHYEQLTIEIEGVEASDAEEEAEDEG